MRRRFALALLITLALMAAGGVVTRSLASAPQPAPRSQEDIITGVVRDAEGPIADAVVRVQNTENKTTTAEDGSFILKGIVATEPVTVTAWAEGYYFGWANALPGAEPVTITLKRFSTGDNLDYSWASSEICSECHMAYPEWKDDAHSQTAVNPRFLTMYKGTDVHGNQSPPTRYGPAGVLPPDPDQPYYGPGYKLDFPDRAGNCAACHTPLAESAPLQTCAWQGCHTEQRAAQTRSTLPRYGFRLEGIDPTGLTGVAAEGITCDFCHKIGDVILDPKTKLPHTDRPGILSMRLYRPEEGQKIFFGPLDDVAADVDTYLPLQKESAFCAPCHRGVFGAVDGKYGGVVIYNSYGEWLESPYSDPETGKTCQDCHMPTVDYDSFVLPEKGGLRRGPDRIHNHRMPGAQDQELLQNSVTMTATAQLEGDTIAVEVQITNDKTGHHVPTGAPMRNMLLVLEATDAKGNPLLPLGGPTLPDWAGDYAGQPGRGFAKILEDLWTGESPTAAYWRPIRVVSDTRIPAMATDVSRYIFASPGVGQATIRVRLIYRRAFPQLMEWKGWDDPDILMEEETIVLETRRFDTPR
ncbi:MAG: hypothetical protein GXP39_01585 [Chloroflexi bacterium]|nr:hypothetical protein [Chloroflexota bacterium]